jgi:hypothetical protein
LACCAPAWLLLGCLGRPRLLVARPSGYRRQHTALAAAAGNPQTPWLLNSHTP